MSFQEVIEKLKGTKYLPDILIDQEQFLEYKDADGEWREEHLTLEMFCAEFGLVNYVDKIGEFSDSFTAVVYFKTYDFYMEIKGWYSSYSGMNIPNGWYGVKQVFPHEKIVIYYK